MLIQWRAAASDGKFKLENEEDWPELVFPKSLDGDEAIIIIIIIIQPPTMKKPAWPSKVNWILSPAERRSRERGRQIIGIFRTITWSTRYYLDSVNYYHSKWSRWAVQLQHITTENGATSWGAMLSEKQRRGQKERFPD